MTTIINTDTENTNLPKGTPGKRLLALPTLDHWWTADVDKVNLSGGKIASFIDHKSQNANYLFAQSDPTRRATLTLGAFGNEAGATFDPTSPADVYQTAVQPQLTGTCTYVVFYRPTSDLSGALQGILGNFVTTPDRFGLWLRNTVPYGVAYVGAGVAGFPVNVLPNVNQCTMLAKTATSMTVRHRGVNSAPVAHSDGVGAGLFLGAGSAIGTSPFQGVIGDVLKFNINLLDGSPDAATALALLTEVGAEIYPGTPV